MKQKKQEASEVPRWISFLSRPLVFFLFALLWIPVENIGALINPSAAFEDGRELLAFYHGPAPFETVFRYYQSYVSLGPNLMGWAIAHAPLDARPLLLVAVSILCGAAAFTTLMLPSVRILGLSSTGKLAIALGALVLPLGNMALYTLLMYALWHLLILVVVLVLFWSPRSGLAAVAAFPVLTLGITSHPASICLLPFLLWRAWDAAGAERKLWAGAVVVLLLYLGLGVDWGGGASSGAGLPSLALLWSLLSERVVFEGLFGTFPRMQLVWRDLPPVMWGVSGLVLTGVAWGVVRAFAGRTVREMYQPVATVGLFFAFFLFSAVVRDLSPETIYEHRYYYPSQILLIVLIVWAVRGVWPAMSFVPGGGRKGRFVLGACVLALAGTTLLHQRYHRFDPMLGHSLAEAIALYQQQEAAGPACILLDRGEWSVRLASAPGGEPCTRVPGMR